MKYIQTQVNDKFYERLVMVAIRKGIKLNALVRAALGYYVEHQEIINLSDEVALNALKGEGNKNS
jgi:hypothetical protein